MFEIEVMTKAKLLDVVVLSQKNRQPDEDPGAKLSFELALTNDALAGLDGHLKSFLFTRNGGSKTDAQQTIEGLAPVTDAPNLSSIGEHVPVINWAQESTGYTVEIDLGLGGKRSNLTIGGCKLSKWRLYPKQGGTVLLKFNAESSDVSGEAFGKLAKLKSREVSITLHHAEIEQQQTDIEGPGAGAAAPGGWDGMDNVRPIAKAIARNDARKTKAATKGRGKAKS